jgi:hypothetical protein
MLSRRIVGLASAVAVFVCLTAATVSAQPVDKRTTFTFSGPVALPGVTLPAGQYLFRLADPVSASKAVQVLDAAGKKPLGMFFTIPAERIEPASSPEVRFMETASGRPSAIRTWWYPGERTGYEFIFPKEQARQLAAAADQPVLTTQAQTTTTEQTNTAELTRVGSSGLETNVDTSAAPPAAAPTGATQQGQIASSSLAIATPSIPAVSVTPAVGATTSAGTSMQADTARRTQLPRTASQLPMLAMIGTMTLMTAAVLRQSRRRKR